jgi:hypothetical protein
MADQVCEEGVTRRGEYEPCDKPAVAERWYEPGEAEGGWSPVCPYHTRGKCRPLRPDGFDYEYAVMGRERDAIDRRRLKDFIDDGDGAPMSGYQAEEKLRTHYSGPEYKAYVAVRGVEQWRRAAPGEDHA